MAVNNIRSNNEKIYYVSPLEIRHYVLELPVTKAKYQYNAVKFALRPLYPGNENSTVIDYISGKKNLIGIAANSERVETLKKEYDLILSPALVVSQIVKNGIVISAGKRWLELEVIKNGFPIYLQSYSYAMAKKCLEELERISTFYNIAQENTTVFLFDILSDELPDVFIKNDFILKYIDDNKAAYKTSSARLFIERKNKSGFKALYFFVPLILFLIFLDVFYYKKSNSLKKEVETLKQTYLLEKKNALESVPDNEVIETHVENVCSLSDIMKEIYKTSDTIRILSFSLNGNMIKFEAENAAAIKVLDRLSESELIEEVVLHQSLPQKNGYEKFVISGKVKND